MILRRAHGSVAVEVVVATLIVAALVVPLLTLLFQERDTEQRSRYEYVALLAARDEIGECRMAIAAGAKPTDLVHGWSPLKGTPLDRRLANFAPGLTTDISYTPEQLRIQTKLDVTTSPNQRLRIATVTVKWLDDAAVSPSNANRPTSLQLVFGILTPPWNP